MWVRFFLAPVVVKIAQCTSEAAVPYIVPTPTPAIQSPFVPSSSRTIYPTQVAEHPTAKSKPMIVFDSANQHDQRNQSPKPSIYTRHHRKPTPSVPERQTVHQVESPTKKWKDWIKRVISPNNGK